VFRYVTPDDFKMFETEAYKMGFVHAACGPMVRSSYHADQMAHMHIKKPGITGLFIGVGTA